MNFKKYFTLGRQDKTPDGLPVREVVEDTPVSTIKEIIRAPRVESPLMGGVLERIGKEDQYFGRATPQADRYTDIQALIQSRDEAVNAAMSSSSTVLSALTQSSDFYTQLQTSRVIWSEPSTAQSDFKLNAVIGRDFLFLPRVSYPGLQSKLNEIKDIEGRAALLGNHSVEGQAIDDREKLLIKVKSKVKPSEWQDSMDFKRILDEWSLQINEYEFLNNGMPDGPVNDVTPSINSRRFNLHKQYYEGLVIMRVGMKDVKSTLGTFRMPVSISFPDQDLFEPYDMDNPDTDLISSWSTSRVTYRFGRVGWRYRREYGGQPLVNTQDVRYVVRKINCRDGQLMPVPYIVRRNVPSLVKLILALNSGDYKTAMGLINHFILITGPDIRLLNNGMNIDDFYLWRTSLGNKLKNKLSTTNILPELTGTEIKMVQPDVAALINSEKYGPSGEALLAAMDMPMIGTGSNKKINTMVLVAALQQAEQAERERWELDIIRGIIQKQNPTLGELMSPMMWLKPSSLFETPETLGLRRLLYTTGFSSYETSGAIVGQDSSSEATLRLMERDNGMDDLFETRTQFKQGTDGTATADAMKQSSEQGVQQPLFQVSE
jgi:hypothetical protein